MGSCVIQIGFYYLHDRVGCYVDVCHVLGDVGCLLGVGPCGVHVKLDYYWWCCRRDSHIYCPVACLVDGEVAAVPVCSVIEDGRVVGVAIHCEV